MLKAQLDLRKLATQKKAKSNAWFFKTEPGQYGHGDQFIGVTVPEVRKLAKIYSELKLSEIAELLKSKIHEDRLLALVVLGQKYKASSDIKNKETIVKFYLKNKSGINNWDLVDNSSYKILGDYCLQQNETSVLRKLVRSKHHWDRRMAVVSTLAFIKCDRTDLIYEFAEILLNDHEDLMHKATGWMLREAGKKDLQKLRQFINRFGNRMPRTMLRYAIEKMSADERQKILIKTRKSN